MSLLLLAAVWALLITAVSVAVGARLRSGSLSVLGGAAAVAATIATFPLGMAVSGVGGISWSNALISAAILAIPGLVAGFLMLRLLRRRIDPGR